MNPTDPKPVEHPRSVYITAVLQILQGLLFFWIAGTSDGITGLPAYIAILRTESLAGMGSLSLTLAVAGFLAVIFGVLLLRFKPWAWLLSLWFQGLALMFALIRYVNGSPLYPIMVSGVLLVFYLNLQEIQSAFRGKREAL